MNLTNTCFTALSSCLISRPRLNNRVKSSVSLRKSWKQGWKEYCTPTVTHTQTQRHTQLLHVQSTQGPRWYSLILRALVLVCTVNPVTSGERLKHYYHIITGVIRALFGAHSFSERARVCFEKAFFFRQSIYLPTLYCSKFPPCFPPLSRGLLKPSVDARTAEKMRCSTEQKAKQESRNGTL